ncbi:MAG: hypothetical protein RMY34_32010 [Aulosira sp. DedQUE10]|nr:hypothetical protein [Aulosira sp. DedQUE10]
MTFSRASGHWALGILTKFCSEETSAQTSLRTGVAQERSGSTLRFVICYFSPTSSAPQSPIPQILCDRTHTAQQITSHLINEVINPKLSTVKNSA